MATLSAFRFSYVPFPAFGRNALFKSCHCFPVKLSVGALTTVLVQNIPFFRIPKEDFSAGCGTASPTTVDIIPAILQVRRLEMGVENNVI